MPATKAKADDTLKTESLTYVVKLDDDTTVSVEATSAAEAVDKAKAIAGKKVDKQ